MNHPTMKTGGCNSNQMILNYHECNSYNVRNILKQVFNLIGCKWFYDITEMICKKGEN